jgi:S-adenosylmethionine synthetase
VLNFLHEQSVDIAQGVARDGAGDQGIMFGYAVDETPELMPAPILYAHAILRRLAEARKAGELPMLGPDAKSQLSIRYADGKPVEVTQLVVSHQHLDPHLTSDDVKRHRASPMSRRCCPTAGSTAAPNGMSTRPASS